MVYIWTDSSLEENELKSYRRPKYITYIIIQGHFVPWIQLTTKSEKYQSPKEISFQEKHLRNFKFDFQMDCFSTFLFPLLNYNDSN